MNHVNFTHDFNPGNGPAVSPIDSGNGFGARVFWTAVVPDSAVQVNPLTGAARMHVRNLPELDYYSPAGLGDVASLGSTWQTGYFASTVSMDVAWNGPVTRRVNVRDAANGFAGIFSENQATVTWSANSASGFSFTSNPGSFSTSAPETPGVNGVSAPLNFFAQLGFERNGIFFRSDGAAALAQAFATFAPRGNSLAVPAVSAALVPAGSDLTPRDNDSSPRSDEGESRLASDLKNGMTGQFTAKTAKVVHAALDRAFASISGPASAGFVPEIGHPAEDMLI